jgi:hypothetical protein
MEAHNSIIYPVCLYNVFFTKNCQKLHILLAGELINELTTLYKAIQHYTMLYKTIQHYIRLYETIQHCKALYKTIRHYTRVYNTYDTTQ